MLLTLFVPMLYHDKVSIVVHNGPSASWRTAVRRASV
jgi:hypothetical protein